MSSLRLMANLCRAFRWQFAPIGRLRAEQVMPNVLREAANDGRIGPEAA